ncbi:hypothetical protein B296_00033110 [Ensete ventricosum]|uniref:Uncharacterized protein n=1 Tax=Ensete ventricosum TaxID=4639 RepID=A0A427A9W9_ENSVE|nr:hypothetical protein B296_00033110 [Ensete ventricosum]
MVVVAVGVVARLQRKEQGSRSIEEVLAEANDIVKEEVVGESIPGLVRVASGNDKQVEGSRSRHRRQRAGVAPLSWKNEDDGEGDLHQRGETVSGVGMVASASPLGATLCFIRRPPVPAGCSSDSIVEVVVIGARPCGRTQQGCPICADVEMPPSSDRRGELMRVGMVSEPSTTVRMDRLDDLFLKDD